MSPQVKLINVGSGEGNAVAIIGEGGRGHSMGIEVWVDHKYRQEPLLAHHRQHMARIRLVRW